MLAINFGQNIKYLPNLLNLNISKIIYFYEYLGNNLCRSTGIVELANNFKFVKKLTALNLCKLLLLLVLSILK